MSLSDIKTYEGLIRLEMMYETPDALKEFLRQNRLIRKTGKKCCRQRRMSEGAYGRDRLFGRIWRCHVCKNTEGLLKGSFFANTHLTPFVILNMAYTYVAGLNIGTMYEIVEDMPASTAVTDWAQYFRDVMSKEVIRETVGKVGGPGKLVVVDETVLAKRKYHRGRPVARETCWVFGIYDVESKQGTLEFIQNRSRDEMIPKILAKVEPGSVIHTDDHRSYASLAAHGYTHKTVNHSQTFKALDGTHTNHVEGYFSRMKAFLRKRSTKKLDMIPGYLDEFMWLERHRGTKWKDFIAAIQRQYRLP